MEMLNRTRVGRGQLERTLSLKHITIVVKLCKNKFSKLSF